MLIFLVVISVILIAANCYMYYLAYSEFLDLKSNLESLKKVTLYNSAELWNMASTKELITKISRYRNK